MLAGADQALGRLNEKRQHGSGRFGNNVQEFAVNFAGFVRVYGSFVDVVRQGGSIYAEVAYGTLSMLFMVSLQSWCVARIEERIQVALSKAVNDTKFAGTLRDLQNSFPRVNLAEDIYPESTVQTKVTKVYRQVIVFAQRATEYFRAHSTST